MPALKRCPFCGDRVGYFGYDDQTYICTVRCNNCTAAITAYDPAPELAKRLAEWAWNLRPPEPDIAILVGPGGKYAVECFTCAASSVCVGGRPRPCPQRDMFNARARQGSIKESLMVEEGCLDG